MNKIRGIILDIDGTLVDSNAAPARAWVEALATPAEFLSSGAARFAILSAGNGNLREMQSSVKDTAAA